MLYFSYFFFSSTLYFVPKEKKPGMYSYSVKNKREKLYLFGNGFAEFLQDSISLDLSVAKIVINMCL